MNSPKTRILYVEDNKDTCVSMAVLLSNYTLTIAQTSGEGARVAQTHYFDLYLLDTWLPDGTGVELCRQLRTFDPHTPILFYSAVASEATRQQALAAGAQDYLIKPVGGDRLELTI